MMRSNVFDLDQTIKMLLCKIIIYALNKINRMNLLIIALKGCHVQSGSAMWCSLIQIIYVIFSQNRGAWKLCIPLGLPITVNAIEKPASLLPFKRLTN